MCLIFIGLCLMILPALAGPVQVEAGYVNVYGKVADRSGDPISGAHAIFWNIEKSFTAKTNTSGIYNLSIQGWKSYQVYAYYDNSSTLGFDYVPAYNRVSVENSPVNVSLTLLPGASINAEGELRSFRSSQSPKVIVFTVVDQEGLLRETNSVTEYGQGVLESYLLSLPSTTIVVPSNTPIKVNVSVFFPGELAQESTIDNEGNYLSLDQGELMDIDLRKYAMGTSVNLCYDCVASANAAVEEAEGFGFYVSYERNELSKARGFVETAEAEIAKEDYDGAQANLHQAYLIAKSVENGVQSLYVNASKSVMLITPFLGLTAIAIASIFFDDRLRRLALSLVVYGALFGLLYVLYPGYAALWKSAFIGLPLTSILIVASFLISHGVVYGLPYAFREKTMTEGIKRMSAVAAAFSMSVRNLRRRKLRTSLMLTLLFTSVFAFTALTSFSLEHGLFVHPQLIPPGPKEGFVLRKLGENMPFEPMQPSIIDWLQERSEVALAVPRLENLPQGMLGYITALKSGSFRAVYGVIGVFPSLEADFTEMTDIVVQGRFLHDDDLNGVLISNRLANALEVEVNDTLELFDMNFSLTGIFDDGGFGGLKDLGGIPLAPLTIPSPGLPMKYCESDWVVIMHQETARKFPWMAMLRIDVQTRSPDEIISTARLAVLRWQGISAFATVKSRVYRVSVGSYHITSGFASAMIPLSLVVLNVAVTMISVVYERRREIAIMSSVGLNPFHLSAVFVAEAVVIGVIAGSLGYIFGLTSYRLMALLPVQPTLKQKVEGSWSLIVLCVSIATAVLGSAVPAVKASTIVTPSLTRRWKIKITEKPKTAGEAWILEMPIRIRRENLEGFFDSMKNRMQKQISYRFDTVDNLKLLKEAEPAVIRLSFTYSCSEEGIVTDNELFVEESSTPDWYTVNLSSKTRRGSTTSRDKRDVKRTASFIRSLILQYSQKQKVK